MARYEYKVVAAPRRVKSVKGINRTEDRFATCLAEIMNRMARDDWEYLRAESLPCEERSGLTGRIESYQSVLVFRRRIRAGQTFFEVPPTHRIELHDEPEDVSEQDIVFSSTHRHASVSVPDETASEGTRSGALSILRHRKARLTRQNTDGDSDDTRMAAE